ncbi:hypothetical protein BV210_18345 (plasmid) [Halorientalis sp. IM1011]|uniref:hypothetical protein n=1 Tax=Halorientalis sp. IM1011 TaxID=1932360 RepID=UPI00097CCA79|nr:hypothetical protein [Halorientalis sp. IM1011]AQL44715.1 hypothetical protein BV210_18345 [Halorientalis sp. IM1011]
MDITPTMLSRFGAWGQIGILVLGVVFWALEIGTGLLAACVGYFIVTMAGIIGIARTESAIDGAIVFPFLVPGFVPLYHFATR